MKRDLDLVRKLMFVFEAEPAGKPILNFSLDTEARPEIVLAHIALMIEADLLKGESHPNVEMPDGGHFYIDSITWAGYDFIDSARSDTNWNATKERLKKAGSWTFGLVLDVLKDEAKRQLGSLLS